MVKIVAATRGLSVSVNQKQFVMSEAASNNLEFGSRKQTQVAGEDP
jgi:hypothetical protein